MDTQLFSILFYIFAPPLFFFTWFYILYIVYYLRILYFPQQNIPIQHTMIHLWVCRQILQRTCGSEGRKLKAEISSRKYVDSLKEAFSRNSVNYFEVGEVVTSNCMIVSLFCWAWSRYELWYQRGQEGDPCIRPRILNAISLAENVRTPWLSSSWVTMLVGPIRPVLRVQLEKKSIISEMLWTKY